MAKEFLPLEVMTPLEEATQQRREILAQRKEALSPLQSIFVNHFFECNCDISTAAMRAGVKVAEARAWVEKDGPTSRKIAERLAELEENSKITVEAIEKALWEEATRMPSGPKDLSVNHAARVTALSHLAKYKGMFDRGGKGTGKSVVVNIDIGGDVGNISGSENEHS